MALKIGMEIKIPDIGPEAKVLELRENDVLVDIDDSKVWIPKEFLSLVMKEVAR